MNAAPLERIINTGFKLSIAGTPESQANAMRYLAQRSPMRYVIRTATFLEGVYQHYRLYDHFENCFIGNEIVLNTITKEFNINQQPVVGRI